MNKFVYHSIGFYYGCGLQSRIRNCGIFEKFKIEVHIFNRVTITMDIS